MKIKDRIVVGFVCVVLGIGMATQYKLIQNNYLNGLSPSKRQSDLTNEYINLKKEKDRLIVKLEESQNILITLEAAASEKNDTIKDLQEKIADYEILAGMRAVIGPGVVITIDNPPGDFFNENGKVEERYIEILSLVNELNSSGAEAISINEQRIISLSGIRTAGRELIINGVPQTAPIVVRAIGKKQALEGSITPRGGIVATIREGTKLLVDVKVMDEVKIPKYTGTINFKYIKPIIQ